MFAPRGNPCGMFSIDHLILFIITMIIVITLYILTSNMKEENIKKVSKITSFVVLVLELVKIGYNFYYKQFNVNYWVPVSYCATFLYAIFLASFSKGIFKKIGESFVSVCFIAGFAFLVFPTTSLTEVPAYHYLALYSFLYHGVMLYFGLLYTKRVVGKVDKYTLFYSSIIIIASTIVALILNAIYDTNVMFVSKPPYIPIEFIMNILNKCEIFITPIVLLVYIFVPFLFSYTYSKILQRRKK